MLTLLALTGTLEAFAGWGPLATIREEYVQTKKQLSPHVWFSESLDDDPEAIRLQEHAWELAGNWCAAFLDELPVRRAEDLKASLAELDPDLGVEVVELRPGTFVVSTSLGAIGTFFVVAKRSGHEEVVWRVSDWARHASGSPLAAWSPSNATFESRRSGFEETGPLFGSVVVRLPDDENRRPRFYVDAVYSGQGLSISMQLSVWAWDGNAALPLLVKERGAMLMDSRQTSFDGTLLRIPTKEYPKTFSTYGPSPDPQGTLIVRITPEGVEDLGVDLEEPAFALVDNLLDRLGRGERVDDIASPLVARKLAPLLRAHTTDSHTYLGAIEGWEARSVSGGRLFTLNMDEGSLRFTLKNRNGRAMIRDVRITGWSD
jgi:hypothetical protein